jgi:excisionase family DNA binding protein
MSDQILTMEEAAERLGISGRSVRRMIERKTLHATQVVACAPWQIRAEALETEAIKKAVRDIKSRVHLP